MVNNSGSDSKSFSQGLKDEKPSISSTRGFGLNQALTIAQSSEAEKMYLTPARIIKTLAEKTAKAV
ncbi:hypothetical protein MNBD_ALPHA03-757 [hydrothermal vent metagenome]|uniref:Uncharacterized protein n=1 Tax=hydrothermal vent metagenome TaxID=652676 RepID=A0A3B1ARB9_9ZZZZ